MKTRFNSLLTGIFAFTTIALFVQCKGEAVSTNPAPNTSTQTITNGMKIAYVEMDSLLMQYDFWNDVTEAMMKKQEDMTATINTKIRDFENDYKDFQRKIDNNAFLSRERVEQEQNRLMKKEQDIQNLQNKLAQELSTEAQKNDLEIRDAINSFVEEYNKDKGYTFIISNTGNSNLLFADKAYDITKEIVDGLNALYTSSKK